MSMVRFRVARSSATRLPSSGYLELSCYLQFDSMISLGCSSASEYSLSQRTRLCNESWPVTRKITLVCRTTVPRRPSRESHRPPVLECSARPAFPCGTSGRWRGRRHRQYRSRCCVDSLRRCLRYDGCYQPSRCPNGRHRRCRHVGRSDKHSSQSP
jgi:hypothetical protein